MHQPLAAASLCFSFFLSLFNTYTHGTPMSAFRPSVHAYQSLWYIQVGDKLPRAWSAPSQPVWCELIGGLLSRLSLTAACCSPPALFISVSVTNRKSHGEDLLINIDLITARQRWSVWMPFPLVAQVRNCLTSQNCLTDKTQLAEAEKWNGWGNNMQICQCAI